jgi:hypothetical protein
MSTCAKCKVFWIVVGMTTLSVGACAADVKDDRASSANTGSTSTSTTGGETSSASTTGGETSSGSGTGMSHPELECPAAAPSVGTSCDVWGMKCTYPEQSACGDVVITIDCYGYQWAGTLHPCCPDQIPESGEACTWGDIECDYRGVLPHCDDGTVNGKEVYDPGPPSAACRTCIQQAVEGPCAASQAACANDDGCRELAQCDLCGAFCEDCGSDVSSSSAELHDAFVECVRSAGTCPADQCL